MAAHPFDLVAAMDVAVKHLARVCADPAGDAAEVAEAADAMVALSEYRQLLVGDNRHGWASVLVTVGSTDGGHEAPLFFQVDGGRAEYCADGEQLAGALDDSTRFALACKGMNVERAS